ncbi:MAG: hypothetical protein ABEJ22_06450 [Haloferacaceae archaeon]
MSSTPVDRLRQPEYTGENRCIPCTAVNVAIALVLAVAVGFLSALAGGAVFVVSLVLIALRGYLVPGTPTLTKRYFPDWVLARFDKVERPAGGAAVAAGTSQAAGTAGSTESDSSLGAGGAGSAGASESDGAADDPADEPAAEAFVDPEEVLVGAGAVEPCEDVDDLCLTDWFAEAWRSEAARLRDDEDARREAVETVFGETDNLLCYEDEDDGRFHAYDGNEQLHVWVSRGAMLADLGANEALAEREGWGDVPTAQRLAIGRALRSFLEVCPVCGGEVRMTEDTVESCCRSWEVVAVRCGECDEHFLEIDPQTMGVVDDYGASVGNAGGPEGVGGGFTRG